MKRKRMFTGAWLAALAVLFLASSLTAADTTGQLITNMDAVLKANPMPAADKIQMITVAQDDNLTFYVARLAEGAEIKPHYHKTHDETVYVYQGTGKMLIDGKWIDVGPGAVHFNPMTKIHATRNAGKDHLVIISIFTPAMKSPDRIMVQ